MQRKDSDGEDYDSSNDDEAEKQGLPELLEDGWYLQKEVRITAEEEEEESREKRLSDKENKTQKQLSLLIR